MLPKTRSLLDSKKTNCRYRTFLFIDDVTLIELVHKFNLEQYMDQDDNINIYTIKKNSRVRVFVVNLVVIDVGRRGSDFALAATRHQDRR